MTAANTEANVEALQAWDHAHVIHPQLVLAESPEPVIIVEGADVQVRDTAGPRISRRDR